MSRVGASLVSGASESRIQQEIVMWFWNSFVSLRGGLCYNLNNSVGGYRGKINRFLGLVAGRSDMTLYYQGNAYMIELKTATGRQSNKQKEWQSFIEGQGFTYVVIRSLEEFKEFVGELGIKEG